MTITATINSTPTTIRDQTMQPAPTAPTAGTATTTATSPTTATATSSPCRFSTATSPTTATAATTTAMAATTTTATAKLKNWKENRGTGWVRQKRCQSILQCTTAAKTNR
eukprot:TRINITY_DN10043_c0_g3_i4.p1 TRINITY_DN10043_c0_g3~~TRINITY_DN10043_c0_g3_i4.p1  ORF type:complete len:120 (+),score=42.42 TRINITY_DN10043_c0_g3_i4:31-360(+)